MDFIEQTLVPQQLCSGIGNTKTYKTVLKLCRESDEDPHQSNKVSQELRHRSVQVSAVMEGAAIFIGDPGEALLLDDLGAE